MERQWGCINSRLTFVGALPSPRIIELLSRTNFEKRVPHVGNSIRSCGRENGDTGKLALGGGPQKDPMTDQNPRAHAQQPCRRAVRKTAHPRRKCAPIQQWCSSPGLRQPPKPVSGPRWTRRWASWSTRRSGIRTAGAHCRRTWKCWTGFKPEGQCEGLEARTGLIVEYVKPKD